MRIAVTSGYAKSRHAIALVTLLHRAGHSVVLCLNVKAFNLQRIRIYLRHYGPRLFSIVRRRMFSRGTAADMDAEVKYIQAFLRRQSVSHTSLQQACIEAGARLVQVSSLNDATALAALDAHRPDLIVYAGGGLLRKGFLSKAAIGVLNAHGGPLPQIRGMNSAEWALFKGMQPGASVHFIDTGVDTGPTLFFKPQSVAKTDSIGDIRGKAVVTAVEALMEAVQRVADGSREAKPQRREDGLQYFNMHPLLMEIVEDWVKRGLTPNASGVMNTP